MLVKDIWEELKEAAGSCSSELIFTTLTRAVELLANRGLFDPLIGTVDFTVDGGFLIALPRDVKTPIRLNINNNPAFSRSRIYEYSPNSDGSNDGEEVGWQWHERGYSCIQDERKLPSLLRYKVENVADNGKPLIVTGIDPEGHERKETLIGATADPAPSENIYSEVRSVSREPTAAETYLVSDTGNIARYYGNEECPEYRVIKLSKTGVAVRMIYRKHVFKLSSQEDIIPLHSAMAVIRAFDSVRLMQRKKYEDAKMVMSEAVLMIGDEQKSRDESENLAGTMEIQSARNVGINSNDVLIVADVYDMAAEILGPIGRAKIFDRITDAINALANKSQWESLIGWCDLYRETAPLDGVFVLPRDVGAVLAVNVGRRPSMARNRWFQYHLNGTGETKFASCGKWDDAGDVAIVNSLPRVEKTRVIVPSHVFAVPNSALDEDASIRIFGVERLENGNESTVIRDEREGWICPCKSTDREVSETAPKFVEIHRIERAATQDFVTLYVIDEDLVLQTVLGYWYPNELSPKYRSIKLPGAGTRIRVRYRKRTNKIEALHDVINLRSRLAIENMLRALASQSTNPETAVQYEALALGYLMEEQAANNPIVAGGLQFDTGTSPGHNWNVQ